MKIAVISPILAPVGRGADQREQFRLRDCQGVPAEFVFSYIPQGPRFIEAAYDDTYAAPELIRQAVLAERAGADAVVINCSADTGLRACREALSIPVIGPTESAMLYAPQLVDSYTVLTFSHRIDGRFRRIAHELGQSHRLAGVRSVEMDFDHISGGAQPVVDALCAVIAEVYAQQRCDGFILGCTDFEDVAPLLEEALKRGGVEVVLLRPFRISVFQAYITVAMELRQGTQSYPRPKRLFE